MNGLVEFLHARLDEDERAARACWAYDWATGNDRGDRTVTDTDTGTFVCWLSGNDPAGAAHIARHDPARVLREVEAKRRIIEEVTSWKHDYVDGDTWFSCGLADDPDFPDEDPGSGCADEDRRGTCNCGLGYRQRLILGPLALSYADHPDYREEWKP